MELFKNYWLELSFAAVLIATSIVLVVALRRRKNSLATSSESPEDPLDRVGATLEELAISQKSLIVGVGFWLVVGLLIDYFYFNWWLDLLGVSDLWFTHTAVIAFVAGLGFWTGLKDVPVGFRGAILILGTRRLKKKGKGLSEGYQWVPYPLATLITVDCREKTLDIGDEDGAPSKDRVFFTVKAIRQFKVNDVYRYQGTEGPVEALRRVDLQALRTEMKQFMAVDLQVTDKTSLSNKVSKRSEDELEKKDNANGKRWGLDVGDVIISDIKVNSKEVAEAWASIPKEQSEREAEKIQAEALVQQVTTLKGLDIDPAFALASAQAHAGKNVEVKTVNIPGLQEGLANMAKTIGDSLGAILKRAVTKE